MLLLDYLNHGNRLGGNAFTTTEPSPLSAGTDAIMTVKDDVEFEQIERLLT